MASKWLDGKKLCVANSLLWSAKYTSEEGAALVAEVRAHGLAEFVSHFLDSRSCTLGLEVCYDILYKNHLASNEEISQR